MFLCKTQAKNVIELSFYSYFFAPYALLIIYIINCGLISGFVFVCRSRTIIFGNRKVAHVHLEGWKHGNGEVGLNMACTQ